MYTTPRADQYNISDLRATADIVEEVNDLLTYIGFCQPGTALTSEPKFSILRIEQSGAVVPIITTFKWAEGRAAFDLIWDNRSTYTYKFKTF